MKKSEILPVSILLVIAAIACVLLATPYIFPSDAVDDDTAVRSDLDYLNTHIKTVLFTIANNTTSAAEVLSSAKSLSAPEVQTVLDRLFSGSGYALSYGVINPNGTIIAVVPEAYAGSVGINIAGSEPGKTIIQTQESFLSNAFYAQEGFTGIEIASPIFSDKGEYLGSVLAMAEPSAFVGEIVAPIEDGQDITVTVMQPDGFILYDRDAAQVGKNLFEDLPFTNYQSLQALGKNISANAAGSGEYTFYSSPENTGELVKKYAEWDTMAFLDKEWRIVIFRDETEI